MTHSKEGMFFSQNKYVTNLLKVARILDSKTATPIEPDQRSCILKHNVIARSSVGVEFRAMASGNLCD